MREGFLDSRGIAYRASDILPDRKTLLFIHGLSGSLSAWAPYEERFRGFNLVLIDLRGHGLSVHPKGSDYTMREFVEDIRILLEHLNVVRVSVVSHSFGTLVAMEFAHANPALVERTIFLAPSYGVHQFWLSRALVNIAAAFAFIPLRVRAYGRTDYTRFYPTSDYSVTRIFTDITNMGLRSYFFAFRLVFSRNFDPDWPRLTQPTLITHGTCDSIVPINYARVLSTKLTGSKLVEIRGANHILVLNNVDDVSKAIEEFITTR